MKLYASVLSAVQLGSAYCLYRKHGFQQPSKQDKLRTSSLLLVLVLHSSHILFLLFSLKFSFFMNYFQYTIFVIICFLVAIGLSVAYRNIFF